MEKNFLSRAHPWHGIPSREESPRNKKEKGKAYNAYIEIIPTDTVKYEMDKQWGLLKLDRPQQYSNYCPSLYGFIPQTYCGDHIGKYCMKKTGLTGVRGDGDPLDICVLTEKAVLRADILVKAIPIGGFRMVDGGEADDKIIAVLEGDFIYGQIGKVEDCPPNLIDRLRHYFLTYKDLPGQAGPQRKRVQITHVYGREEARKVIELSRKDYRENFSGGS